MKKTVKITKKVYAILLTFVLLFAMQPTVCFADEVDTITEITAIVDKINNEYGTEIRMITKAEADAMGVDMPDLQDISDTDLAALEERLRYCAEELIPQFKRNTQNAIASMEKYGLDLSTMVENCSEMSSARNSNLVYASTGIDGGIAYARAYIVTD